MKKLALLFLLLLPLQANASRLFGAATSDRINIAPSASINMVGNTTGTWMAWVRPNSFAALKRVMAKGGSGNSALVMNVTTGTLNMSLDRVTSDSSYTSVMALTINTWNFIAVTWDTAAGAGEVTNIHIGNLTTPAVESTYSGSPTDGSGNMADDSALDLIIGNRSTNNTAFTGDIAVVGVWNRALSLAEIRSQQFHPRVTTGNGLLMHLGFGGTSEVDWSGNRNAGTVTGATISRHVPLGNSFGR